MVSSVNAILVFVILLVIGVFAIVVILSRLTKTLEQLKDAASGIEQALKQLNEIIQTDIQSGPDITPLRRTEE